MSSPPFTLAELVALPDVEGFPPPERLRLYMAYLRYQLRRPEGVWQGSRSEQRTIWREKRKDGHLAPTALKVLTFIAQQGIATTVQTATEMDLARGTLLNVQDQLIEGAYVEYRPGKGHGNPGTYRITRKGLERAGFDPDTPVPTEMPPAAAVEIVPDDAVVICGRCGPKLASDFYRGQNGQPRKNCKECCLYFQSIAKNRNPDQLGPSTQKVLLYVAKHGIVGTTQAAEALGMKRATLWYHYERLGKGGYVEHRSGGGPRAGTLRITRKGLAKAGMNPDAFVPAELTRVS